MTSRSSRGFGLAGEYPLETVRAASVAVEGAGYRSFWLSQPAEGDSLETLADVAGRTSAIELGVGAIPFTLRSPGEMAERVKTLALPADRLQFGVGSGTGPGSLDRLRNGVGDLRQLTGGAIRIVVAPLGPKMCRLAGEVADGVLLNWLTPEYARRSLEWVAEGAESAGRARPEVFTYVRCALGPETDARLAAECMRYGSFPHYARHFRRQGVEPIQTTIPARTPAELQARLSDYEAVLDAVGGRAITPVDRVEQALALVEAASPGA
jgi:alkanesulfonate monooxygenase SsuD/methylene tetrahydromethanopterin reductase-like flavin-dependent oxidoreductase (luciferase family)